MVKAPSKKKAKKAIPAGHVEVTCVRAVGISGKHYAVGDKVAVRREEAQRLIAMGRCK